MNDEFRYRALGAEHLEAIRALLTSNDLPVADLDDPAISLLGAIRGDELVGVIGLQLCDRVGLLRSLAVAPQHRGAGVARTLCEQLFAAACERELAALFLLTTTAADYFSRLGFIAIDRETAPDAVRMTAEFASLCPVSARVMRRSL